jgi:hypothetical protein
LIVERAPAAQHRLEDIGRNAPGGEALRIRGLVRRASVGPFGSWSVRPARGFHAAFLLSAPYIPREPTCHTKSPSRKVEPMPNDPQDLHPPAGNVPESAAERPLLTPAARRALAEAAARRTAREADGLKDAPKEINGRGGPEPTRYGDWEVNGITSDV